MSKPEFNLELLSKQSLEQPGITPPDKRKDLFPTDRDLAKTYKRYIAAIQKVRTGKTVKITPPNKRIDLYPHFPGLDALEARLASRNR